MRSPPTSHATDMNAHAVVLFDGVCNLCNASVAFIIDHDPSGYFRFASLQSDAARRLLEGVGDPASDNESMILFEDGLAYRRSDAALRIARLLGLPWSLFYGALLVPRPLRDAVYRVIARYRYRWFGRRNQCQVPTPALAVRFLTE